MKSKLRSLLIGLILLADLPQSQTACAAVTFSVTPAVVSNTYNGYITLQIGGLTNTETVVIQNFLDINASGAIAANDPMVLEFPLTVGQIGAVVVGGITNVSLPFNSNTNTNAVTTILNFQNGDISQSHIGQYLFEVSSSSGQMTNLLVVTSSPHAQKITGIVFTGINDAAIPDAIVVLFQPSGGGSLQAVGGVVADNAGFYSIPVPAGTYSPVAIKDNFVADRAPAGNLDLVLATGQTLSTNLSLIAATESISGKYLDSTTGIGLPGLLVPINPNS
jgi:hypothetical protein